MAKTFLLITYYLKFINHRTNGQPLLCLPDAPLFWIVAVKHIGYSGLHWLPKPIIQIGKNKTLKLPPEALLFCQDVDSLYTIIETQLGLQAVRDCFSQNTDISRLDEAILQLLEISLTCNDFEFAGEYYLQIKRTVMGKKFAPSYANIYMEEMVFPKCSKLPFCYYQYLDDICGIWQHDDESFEIFL